MAPNEEPVTVIIPAYNEETGISDVIEQLKTVLTKARMVYEVIVVDDGSTDRTASIALSTGVNVIKHPKNIGYGASLKTGIKAAMHEIILITDADGTYPIDRIPELIEGLTAADMVVGARVGNNASIPMVRRPAKWVLGRLAEYITGERIPDLNSGLRAFRRRLALQYLNILPDKFSFTTTITVASLSNNYMVKYLPIDYYKRSGKSKIVPWDFVSFVTLVLRLSMLFNPLKIFIPVSFLCFFLGGGKLLLDIVFALLKADRLTIFILAQPIVSSTTLILLLSGLQILLIGMMSDGLSRRISQYTPSQYEPYSYKEDISSPDKKE